MINSSAHAPWTTLARLTGAFVGVVTALAWTPAALAANSGPNMNIRATVTYPHGDICTLEPEIAFIAPPHDRVQCQVAKDGQTVWDSGGVDSTGCALKGHPLEPDRAYSVRVRVESGGAWGDWSQGTAFSTPVSPIVRIIAPAHAGRAFGPDVKLEWTVESDKPVDALEVKMDGRQITTGVAVKDGDQSVTTELAMGLHTLEITARQGEQTSSAVSQFYVWTSPQAEGDMVVLDLTELGSWDVAHQSRLAGRMYAIMHAAACLEGIVNRKGPRLMLRLYQPDDEWLAFLRSHGAWLEHVKLVTIRNDSNPEQALLETVERFRGYIKGLVQWDPSVPATSNVASTVAGIDDVLPVPAGDLDGALRTMLEHAGLKVKVDLAGKFTGSGKIPDTDIPSTGSAKCDAYLWAKARYLDTGRANPLVLGYWLDSFWLKEPDRMPWWENCLSNHDWVVMNRGFIFDVSNWGDEAPLDDPAQKPGTDLDTFKAIMLSAYQQSHGRMIHVSGFTPWAFKYTSAALPPGKHEPVDTEWEVVRILSAYDAYLDADAHGISAMANASLWGQMPLSDRYVQNPPPTPKTLEEHGYMAPDGKLAPLGFTLLYIGDFDSAAWLYRRCQDLWQDPGRGEVPMGWAFNPNLSQRMAPALHYAYLNMSPEDFFTGGDSGAGYVNPTMLVEPRPISGLPSGEAAWVDHCRRLYRRFDYRTTGFLINGHAGKLTPESERMTAQFSPDGTATQIRWMNGENHLTDNMPVALQMHDLCPDVKASVDCMSGYRTPGLQFLDFRLILLGPSFVKELTKEANTLRPDAPFAMVDPETFFYLLRYHLGGSNNHRAAFTFDTLGEAAQAGREVAVHVGVRNDGWDTWHAGKTFLEWGIGGKVDWQAVTKTALDHDVRPGESLVVTIPARLPEKPGDYVFFYDMGDSSGAFHKDGNPWWESPLDVR